MSTVSSYAVRFIDEKTSFNVISLVPFMQTCHKILEHKDNWLKGAHFLFAVRLEGLLDESEQVLLVHGGGSVDVGVHLNKSLGKTRIFFPPF